jgi:type VII secretion integral membrane protein EccD
VLTAYSRVTVVCGSRKVDLALPSALPVADVVPQVLRFCAPADAPDRPAAWSLARLGGGPLALTQTLADAGVVDGDVLELRGQGEGVRPALVEDVRDALEDSVDASGSWWRHATTVAFALVAGSVVSGTLALAQLLGVDLVDSDGVAELVGAAVATTVAVALTAWSARVAPALVTQTCAGVLVVWGLVCGTAVAHLAGQSGAVELVLAASGALLAALAARLLAATTTALAAAVTVTGAVALALGIARLTPLDPMHVSRLAPVLALLATGVLPRVTLAVGGLASADYRLRNAGRLSDSELMARYRQSNGLLIGGLSGIAAVVAWASFELTFSPDPWDRYLALSVGLVAFLRSRVFSRIPHMLALRSVGVLVLLLQALRVADDLPELQPWFVVAVVVVSLLAVAVSSVNMSPVTRARLKRLLNVVEFLLVVDMVVVAAGALGLFALVAGLA